MCCASGGTSEDLNRAFLGLARRLDYRLGRCVFPIRKRLSCIAEYLNWEEQLPDEISIVELGGKEVFLDPGTRYCPFGMLDWRDANTTGYRQTAKNTGRSLNPANSVQAGHGPAPGTLYARGGRQNPGNVEGGLFWS